MRSTSLLLLGALLLAPPGCGGDTFSASPGEGGSGPSDGGGPSSGGGPTSGGSETGGSGGGVEPECAAHAVEVELVPAVPGDYCLPECDAPWLTVRDAFGNQFELERGCASSCEDCSPFACPPELCAERRSLEETESALFVGRYFQEDTCGEGAACVEAACTPPGDYLVEICLERRETDGGSTGECTGSGEVDCVTKPFVWPQSTSVAVEFP